MKEIDKKLFEELSKDDLDDEAICDYLNQQERKHELSKEHSRKHKNESVDLDEGTSNFGRGPDNFPLLVFYTIDEFYYNMHNHPDYPQEEEFEEEDENGHFYIDWDKFEDAKDEFEQKYWDEHDDICVLDEDEQERLEDKLDDFNYESKRLADNLYDEEKPDDYYALKDIILKIEPGYYEAAYIDVDGEEEFQYMSEEVRNSQLERFSKFFNEIKKEFGLTKLSAGPAASNGERGYSIVKDEEDESLEEDTIKKGNKWVNKGKEGTHGEFKTKKQADAQRKAMFANGYKEELEEDDTLDEKKKKKKEPFVKVGTGFDLAKDTQMTNHMLGSDCCEDFDEYDTDSYYSDDDICIYQFPASLKDRDFRKALEYGLEYLGKVNDMGFQPGDPLIKGTYANLKKYCEEYLDYEMHPYYLYKEGDIDLEDILDPADESWKRAEALGEEKLEEKKFDGKCPYCGSENIDFVDSDEDSEKHVCHDCGQDFLIHDDDEVTTRNNRPIESLEESMKSEVTNWWKDVEDANREMQWGINIDNGDYDDVEAMHAAMFDMLDELDNRGAGELFKRGKAIYNKYAKFSKYNEELEEDLEVARTEYCVMDNLNNNIECFDNTDDAIAFAKDNEGVRVLEVKYGPKNDKGDEPELSCEEVWSIREDLKETYADARYKIEYWVDEEARDHGLGDYALERFDDLEDAKEYADRLFGEVASVEVLDTQDEDNVVYGRYPEDESLDEDKYKYITDPNNKEGEVEAKDEEEAIKKVETKLAQDGVVVSDEIIDVEKDLEEGGPGSGDHRTAAQRYNDKLNATFRRFDEMNNKMAKFLLDHGVSQEEVEELKKNTGLHGNALHQKLIELGLDDEFFERKHECKESISAWSIKANSLNEEIEILVKKNGVWESIASVENCPTKDMLKEDIVKEYSKVAKQVIKESGYRLVESNDDVYSLHVKVIDANTGKVNKVERLMSGSKKECDARKKQLEETSPEDSYHNKNVYKVSKVK